MDAFSIFDEHGQGVVGVMNLRMIMSNLGLRIEPDHKNILTILKRYNRSKDGLLKYSEFMTLICPMS
jgi:Ca2+-binding EF-hand superfamily protein